MKKELLNALREWKLEEAARLAQEVFVESEEFVKELIDAGDTEALEGFFLLGPQMYYRDRLDKHIDKSKEAEKVVDLLDAYFPEIKDEMSVRPAVEDVLYEVSRAIYGERSDYLRASKYTKDKDFESLEIGIGAIETKSPKVLDITLEICGMIPWDDKNEIYSLYDPSSPNAEKEDILLFTVSELSHANTPLAKYDSDLHGDSEFVPWSIWQVLKIESLKGPAYLRRLGEIQHFSGPKVLGILPRQGSYFEDFNHLGHKIYDAMKMRVSEFYQDKN